MLQFMTERYRKQRQEMTEKGHIREGIGQEQKGTGTDRKGTDERRDWTMTKRTEKGYKTLHVYVF